MVALSADSFPNNGANIMGEMFGNFASLSPEGKKHGENLYAYFGTPNKGMEQLARDLRNVSHEQLPAAYEGKNTYLGQFIMGLVVERLDWAISEPDGFPIMDAPSFNIQWSTLRFIDSFTERIPEEGVGRVMLHGSERDFTTLLRRGKAIRVEHGFYKTPEGQRMYVRQIQQVANAVNNTLSYDALLTFVNGGRPKHVRWMIEKGMFGKTPSEMIDNHINSFMGWQKTSYAAEQTATQMKEVLGMRGKEPEMMIAPRTHVEHLLHGAYNSDKLNPAYVGTAAEGRRLVNPIGMPMFAGLRVRYTRAFTSIGFQTGQFPVDPFIQTRIFGEFAQLPPIRHDSMYYTADGLGPQHSKYKSSDRAIRIMDYEKNQWRTITLKDCIKHTTFTKNGGFFPGTKPGDGQSYPDRSGDRAQRIETPFEHYGYNGKVQHSKCFGQTPNNWLTMDVLKTMARTANMNTGEKLRKLKEVLLENYAYTGALMSYADFLDSPGKAGILKLDERVGDKGITIADSALMKNAVKVQGLGKRSRDSSERILYGELGSNPNKQSSSSASSSAVGLPNENEMHTANLASLTAHEVDSAYTNLVTKFPNDKSAIIGKTYAVLSNKNAEEISQLIVDPLKKLVSNKGSKQQREELENDTRSKMLESYSSPSSSTGVKIAGMGDSGSKFAFMTESEVDDLQARGGQFKTLFSYDAAGPSTVQQFDHYLKSRIHSHISSGMRGDFKNTSVNDILTKLTSGVKVFDEETLGKSLEDLEEKLRLIQFEDGEETKEMMYHFLFQRLNETFFTILYDYDIFMPYIPLVVRPNVVAKMATVVFGTGGREMGATLVKAADVMLQDNATDKTHEAFLTYYSKAAVFDHSKLAVVDCVAMVKYLGGGNTRFMNHDDFLNFQSHHYEIPKDDAAGSLYVIWTPYIPTSQLPSKIHLDKGYDLDQVDQGVYFEDNAMLKTYVQGAPEELNPYDHRLQRSNRTCSQLPELLYNPISQKFDAVIYSDINFTGKNHYDGMMTDIHSGSMILKEQNWDDTSKYTNFFSI